MTIQPVLTTILLLALQAGSSPVEVNTITLADVVAVPSFEIPAHVLGEDSLLASERDGVIHKIHVEVGAAVSKGQLLLELDCRQLKAGEGRVLAEVEVIKSQLALAQSQLKRARALRKESQISVETLDRGENEVAVLQARVRVAEASVLEAALEVHKCRLTAPYAGVIAERPGQLGSWASMGTPLLRLSATKATRISAQVSQSRAAQLADGSDLRFIWGEHHLPCEVSHLLPVIDAGSRTREVSLAFTGRGAPPGASGRLSWSGTQKMVPAHLLVQRDKKTGLFLAVDGKAVFHPLPHASEGRPVAVDLPQQTQLITDGRMLLIHGDAVLIK